MKILVKFPTRGRKSKFLNTLMKYYKMCDDLGNMDFLVSIDEDDTEMNNQHTFDILNTYQNLNYVIGKSESKIHAVNRDIDTLGDWDIILLASDDMIPIKDGYDKIIIEKMQENYPDTDGVLFFNDGYQGRRLNTLCILGKKYYERFNYIYHPDYKSTWCDNEFMSVADILDRQTYFDEVIIKHEHPDWGYGRHDSIHQKNYNDLTHDQKTFINRRNKNFGL